MKKVLSFISLLFLVGVLTLAGGCGGGGGSDDLNVVDNPNVVDDSNVVNDNETLVANAGANQNVVTGAQVTLDGSASRAAQGDTLTYFWVATSVPTGSSAILNNDTAVRPTFTADIDGDYTYSLVVNNGVKDSSADSVTITATTVNSAPVANAGSDQNIATGSFVTLDGSGSTDANGDPLIYSWTVTTVPSGSSAALNDDTAARPTFTADVDGNYVFSLTVSDGVLASVENTVVIIAETLNSAPIATAGQDQKVATASLVSLSGNGSDANGDFLNYDWSFTSKPDGSSAVMSEPNTANPTFFADVDGSYVLNLTVSDGDLTSNPVQVVISSYSDYSKLFTKTPSVSGIWMLGYYQAGSSFALRITNDSQMTFNVLKYEMLNGGEVIQGYSIDLSGMTITPNSWLGLQPHALLSDTYNHFIEIRYYLQRPDTGEEFTVSHTFY